MSARAFCILIGLAFTILGGLKTYLDVSSGNATLKGMSADRDRQPLGYAAVVAFDGFWAVAGLVLVVVGMLL